MRILFVCLGNICRSPTAEAVFRRLVEDAGLDQQVQIDSAGTAHWHIGKAPDPRTCAAANTRGYQLDALRGRQVSAEDFAQFDLILAMDGNNLADLERLRPAEGGAELDLYLRRYGFGPTDVPDPYYGGNEGFEQVLDMLERAGKALLAEVRERL